MNSQARLGKILCGLFLFGVAMGAGPGLLLVNPPPSEAGRAIFGVPIIYAWGLFWYAYLAALLVAANALLWRRADNGAAEGSTDRHA